MGWAISCVEVELQTGSKEPGTLYVEIPLEGERAKQLFSAFLVVGRSFFITKCCPPQAAIGVDLIGQSRCSIRFGKRTEDFVQVVPNDQLRLVSSNVKSWLEYDYVPLGNGQPACVQHIGFFRARMGVST